jgi:DNA polymerase (family 10)
VAEVLSKGATRSTVRLKSGIQVDVRVVPEESYGAALHYFTGSKAHNIAVRKMALARGLKINEYGIFRGTERLGGRTEKEIFAAVGLPYIEPELREDRGEIEAAIANNLPRLIKLTDIKGDLHTHTRASGGKNSIAEMAAAAKARGYRYLAITDHARHAAFPRGLSAKRLSAQIDEIDRFNEQLEGIRILKSCEVDILEDGKLALPDSVLKRLDFTLCAIHDGFGLGARAQAERIIRAMDNPCFNILSHPTGRMPGQPHAYPLELDRVMLAAKERGCFLEVNAHPTRLDLNDIHCRAAREIGLKLVISSDAHSATDLGAMRFGIDQARRGWLEPSGVLNTRPWSKLRKMMAR